MRFLLSFAFAMAAGMLRAVDTPEFDAHLVFDPIIARHHVPGLAGIALVGSRIVAFGYAGERKAASGVLIGPDDLFHLGSDTKAMTATLAGLLVEQGALTWQSTIGQLLGRDAPNMRPEWKTVTLSQLLAHRAGLAHDPDRTVRAKLENSAVDPRRQRREFLAEILSSPPEFRPGSDMSYSNTGYVIVAAMIEAVTDQPYELLIQEKVWTPLGIRSGSFGIPGTPGKIDQPWGHLPSGEAIDPGSPRAGDPAFFAPAGLAVMSLPDWAKFITQQLRSDASNPHRDVTLLRSETVVRLHSPARGEGYAGGWAVATRRWAKGPRPEDNGLVLLHAGSNGRSYCVAFVAPEIDFAVIVACNQGGDAATHACDAAAGALIQKYSKQAYEDAQN